MEQGRIFICDDQPEVQQLLRKALESHGHQVEVFASGDKLLRLLEEHREDRPDLILLDLRPPVSDGLEVLRRIKALRAEQTVIVMSAFATVRGAVEAIKQGAHDYLLKPFLNDELYPLVDKVVEHNRLREENRSLKAEIRRRFDPDQVIFKSSAFRRVFELAKKVAPSDASVLIQGESGTGKELIASTIHYSSHRRDQRFLTINCAALTDTLLESQLFGHVKGAFTGAVTTQRGLVEEAHKGTLFLDEIGDVSPSLQAKLLRVLQEGEFIPVGSTKVRHADVRFLAATNKDLETEVAAGRFREDLFYRLNVVTLQVPPLRERKEDVPPLAEFFIARFATRSGQRITSEAISLLRAYDWPGNVRELENVIEMASILADGEDISAEQLPVKVMQGTPVEFTVPHEQMTLAELEALYIEQVYRQTRYHKVRTSSILGISRKTLDRKLVEYGIGKAEI
ncbi:sigma-54 dependent transcriptional regulator [Desulfuromonas carbonis]|uniref:sigma-54-dependent transcriptional regulator n=1 Tax=Desulfuromonas sp. DDH964 TaxID=1823759 RepID=UPI00078ED9B3|nr:sigma-54 dependent transcriptional regulator [Desulfuromonas sp. DDH964]AMV73652.1 sigma-54-dependent transcriptional response regulator [Desulfuromonas sp. DDH964]